MIHEILPHQFDNSYHSAQSKHDHDLLFFYNENTLLLKNEDGELSLPQRNDLLKKTQQSEEIYLFSLDGIHCYLVNDLPEIDEKLMSFKEISFFRSFHKKEIAWAGIVGYQLKLWYIQNRFCGKCGSETQPKNDERAIKCLHCNHTVYPKISPAIIVAIINNDKILLATNPNFVNNWYSLIAGYTDIGESLEETVIREAKEEIGIDVRNIRYYKSQPWPFSGSLMIGFFAEADIQQEIKVDKIEITDAKWFSRGNLPNHPPVLSIAGEMIEKFEKGEI